MKTKNKIVQELIGVIGEIQARSDCENFPEGITKKNLITALLGDKTEKSEFIGFIRGAYGLWSQGFVPYGSIGDVADEIVTHLSNDTSKETVK